MFQVLTSVDLIVCIFWQSLEANVTRRRCRVWLFNIHKLVLGTTLSQRHVHSFRARRYLWKFQYAIYEGRGVPVEKQVEWLVHPSRKSVCWRGQVAVAFVSTLSCTSLNPRMMMHLGTFVQVKSISPASFHNQVNPLLQDRYPGIRVVAFNYNRIRSTRAGDRDTAIEETSDCFGEIKNRRTFLPSTKHFLS